MLNSKLFDDDVEKKATREGFSEGLLEIGEKDERVVVLTADLAESTKVLEFAKKFPERFVECGVAEQNMIGIAAGLAAAGKIPWTASYAVFSPGRSWDQIRVAVCYSNLPVKIAGGHTGLSAAADGATHQALEDIAITRVLPNMIVVVPCDAIEARKATVAGSLLPGAYYLRLTREKTPLITTEESRFEIGKADVLYDSVQDSKFKVQCAIVACGPLVYQALVAAHELEKEGIGVMVINNHTIKPMDRQTIVEVAKKCGAVVTVEEHQVAGGMGSAVAEVLAQENVVPMEFVGMKDSFGESGKQSELLLKYGMSVAAIKEAVKKVIGRKPST